MDSDISKKLSDLRKLERQAKQLLYKMDRIEKEWNDVKKQLIASGREITHQLGDVLHGFRKKS